MLKCPGGGEGERKGGERERIIIEGSCKPSPKRLLTEAGCYAEGLVR